jgi:hypothetical protein
MNYSPNYFLESLRALLTIAGWWLLFYRLHRPATKLRRVALLVSFPVCYVAFMLIPLDNVGNASLWAGIIILFALLCGDLRGSWTEGPLFTAIYYIGIEACIDTLRNFIVRYSIKGYFPGYSTGYYVQFNLDYLVVLGWTVFYYWVMKDQRGKLPLRFWIMMVIPPLGSTALLTHFANTASPLLEMGINIYLDGILFGLFLLALNFFTFYMYLKLLTYYKSHLQAQSFQGQLTAYAHRIDAIEVFQRQAGEMRDEFKSQLSTMNIGMEQKNYDQVKMQVRELLGDLRQAEQESYTGISLIDAMISNKADRLKELGASFSVQADTLDIQTPGSALAAALPYDIASIMAIALDNAADACEKIASNDPLPVGCKILAQKNMLLIQVTNQLPGPLQYTDGEIQSSKAESGHGLGLPTLRWIVQKYAGDLTISDRGNVFCLSIMLFV